MFPKRRTTGSVICPACGSLVGVRDDRCYTCGRSNPGLWGYGPFLRQFGANFGFAPSVIAVSGVMYALTLITSGNAIFRGGLSFLSPSSTALELFGMSGAIPVFVEGRWWTLLTASWLHGNLLHILFNMMWVRDLGASMVDFYGPSRTIVIYTISGVCGFFLSSLTGYYLAGVPFLHGAAYTMGASAAIFGLLGAMVHYGRRGGGSSFVQATATRYAFILFIFGLIMPGVDNYAHAGGFLGGYAASSLVKPNTRERGDHMIAAAVCVAATVLSLGYAALRVLPYFLG